MSNPKIAALLRTAALSALLVVPALAACTTDDSRIAMSGSTLPNANSGPWTHTSNEPNWRGVTYESH